MTTESHNYSYDEILRFKKSAAVVAAKDPSVHGISSAESGLVQTIVDNFDADIHSPNGKLSTHSLAMILTQPSTPGNETDADTIERLKHCDVRLTINEDDNYVNVYYVGQKPPLPEILVPLLTDASWTHQGISNARATLPIHEIHEYIDTLPGIPWVQH